MSFRLLCCTALAVFVSGCTHAPKVAMNAHQARQSMTLALAQAADQAKNMDVALHLYQKAHAYDPKALKPILGIARIYRQMHEYDQALLYTQEAANLAPKNTKIAHELVASAILDKKYFIAEDDLERLLVTNPKDAMALNQMGVLLDMAGKHQWAQACYRRGLALKTGSSANLLNNMGISLVLQHHYRLAVNQLDTAVEQPAAHKASLDNEQLATYLFLRSTKEKDFKKAILATKTTYDISNTHLNKALLDVLTSDVKQYCKV